MTGVESAGRSRRREREPSLPLGYADDVPFEHDPLDPHPEYPTPLELVLALTQPERVQRVHRLTAMAQHRYAEAIDSLGARRVAGVCALVSGGNDSYTVAHLVREFATHIVHANTGTGIEATREHVRATATAWGLPLLEVHPKPGQGYWDLVRGTVMARSRETGELVKTWPGGFPGSAAHALTFQRLKERGLEQVPHLLGISGSRTESVVFVAGRRRPESKRRATVPHYERKNTILWSSPMAVWHKADLRAYRLLHPDVPVNPVAQRLGMSGECGCLANAVADERTRWFTEFADDPFVLAVQAVESELADRTDIPEHRKRWGWAGDPEAQDAEAEYMAERRRIAQEPERVEFSSTALCGPNCGIDPLWDLADPMFTAAGPAA